MGGARVDPPSWKADTVKSVIEVGLVFNFWILDADFYSSFYQFLLNKCPHFHEFLRLLFKSFFYSSHSTITDTTLTRMVYKEMNRYHEIKILIQYKSWYIHKRAILCSNLKSYLLVKLSLLLVQLPHKRVKYAYNYNYDNTMLVQ